MAVVDGYRNFIFVNPFGNVQHQGTLNKALRRIIRDCNLEVLDKVHRDNAANLTNFINHSLRHTFTTRMCEVGVNTKVCNINISIPEVYIPNIEMPVLRAA